MKTELAAAFVLADRFGLSEGICNHFSAVVPGVDERFLINRFGLHWSEIRPDNLLMIDARNEMGPKSTRVNLFELGF